MAEEITMEAITKAIDKALDEKLAPINERLDVIEDNIEIKEEPKDNSGDESEEVKAMKAEIAELKAQRATARVDMLIAEGKILPAQKEAYVELCASNSEKFEEAFKDAPVIVELDNRQSMQAGDSGAGDDPEPTEDEKLIAEVNDAFNKGE
jgi:phage I-like protein